MEEKKELKRMERIIIDNKATGTNIKRLMDERGITIRKMADELFISYQAMYKCIKGITKPSVYNIVTMAKVLDVCIEDIVIIANNDQY